jgi:hypothetical protein
MVIRDQAIDGIAQEGHQEPGRPHFTDVLVREVTDNKVVQRQFCWRHSVKPGQRIVEDRGVP